MIIIKFAMVAFLVGMTLILTSRQGQGPLQGGPYYFLEMPGNKNPLKPQLKLNAWQAFRRKNVWRVWFDSKGHPVELQLFKNNIKVKRVQMVWDKTGVFRSRREEIFP